MKIDPKIQENYGPTLDLPKRIALVASAYKALGYINRRALMNMYGISALQAGALMRDFIHANASKLQWDKNQKHYNIVN